MELGYGYDPRKLKLDAYDLELKRKHDLQLELEQRLKRERGPKLELKRSNLMELELKQERSRGDIESVSLSDFMGHNNYSISGNRIAYGEETQVDNSERNSRCVSVDTISPAPEGRRSKKEMFRGKSQLVKFRCTTYEKNSLRPKQSDAICH